MVYVFTWILCTPGRFTAPFYGGEGQSTLNTERAHQYCKRSAVNGLHLLGEGGTPRQPHGQPLVWVEVAPAWEAQWRGTSSRSV